VGILVGPENDAYGGSVVLGTDFAYSAACGGPQEVAGTNELDIANFYIERPYCFQGCQGVEEYSDSTIALATSSNNGNLVMNKEYDATGSLTASATSTVCSASSNSHQYLTLRPRIRLLCQVSVRAHRDADAESFVGT
jgi:hypothetical protein